MGQDEVLAAGFAHDARVGFIAGDVLADALPDALEHAGGAGEVDAGKIRVLEDDAAGGGAVHVHEVDDAGRHPGFREQLHQHLGRIYLRIGWLPDHYVAHHGHGRGQIAGNGGEVERREGKHEAFERAVLQPVPHAGRRLRLLPVNLLHIPHVEAEKVNQLAGGVDFSLERILALAQHGGRVEAGAVGAGQQVGGFEENGGPLFPGQFAPGGAGGQGGGYGLFHVLGRAGVKIAQHVLMVVRRADALGFAGAHLAPTNVHGNVALLLLEALEFALQFGAFGGAGRVAFHGFVEWGRDVEKAVGHRVGGVLEVGESRSFPQR